MPPKYTKQRTKLGNETKRRKKEQAAVEAAALEEAAAELLAPRLTEDRAASAFTPSPQPQQSCRVCKGTASIGLTAADVLSGCSECETCGQLVPPADVVAAASRVRAGLGLSSLLPAETARARAQTRSIAEDNVPRPHGGPSLRARVPSGLLDAFEAVNGSLELGQPTPWVDHSPVKIRCRCCAHEW